MKKLLIDKGAFQAFVFNLILLLITLFLGNYYLTNKINILNNKQIERQNIVTSKKEYIHNFTTLGQSRIYFAESYIKSYESKENLDTLDVSWTKYIQSVNDWNKENLSNSIFIKYYFGSDSKNEFDDLLKKFANLHEDLLRMKDGKIISNIDEELETAKHSLYILSESLIDSQ